MSSISSDSTILADHIELVVLAHRGENFSRGRILQITDQYWDADEAEVSFAMSVLEQRANILGDRYPLRVNQSFAVFEKDVPIYEALLGLTRTNWFYSKTTQVAINAEKEFEHIAEGCLRDFFGQGTETVNFGWPSDIGRPMEFSPAVTWLANRIGLSVGNSYRPPRRKDGGVDIFVWRNFGDNKPGIPLMLVQATVQLDVLSKTRDVDRRIWSSWLSIDADPLVALAIPGTLSNTEVWNEISCNSLLLDRLRLTKLAGANSPELIERCTPIVSKMHEIVQSLIEEE